MITQPTFRLLLLSAVLLLLGAGCRQVSPAPTTDAVKILVEDEGVYRLSLKQLQQVGLAVERLDQNRLQLLENGNDVPYLLENDSLVFYGQPATGRYSPYRPYILRRGTAGTAMEQATVAQTVGPARDGVTRVLHLEENYEYVSDAEMGDGEEPWFWQTIQFQGTMPLTFDLPEVGDGSGELTVNLYGATHNPDADPDHSLMLTVNERQEEVITWDGQGEHVATLRLGPGSLQSGENQLILDNLPEDFVDIMRLNWLTLSYQAAAIADEGRLDFSGSGEGVTVAGFSKKPLIFDVADPAAPRRLTGWGYENGDVTISPAPEMKIVAVTDEGYRTPLSVEPLRDGGWGSTEQGADLIIITTDALAPALEPLVEARESQGLRVTVVPVADIYDEFGEGAPTPEAIQQFLTHAYQAWEAPAPRYVLLVGDATTDYRGYLAQRPENPVEPPENIVPSYLVRVNFSGETVSDARLADVDGDLKPEMAVGRWPVDDERQVQSLVERTLAYEKGTASGQAIFAADGTSREFEMVTEQIMHNSGFPDTQARVLNGPKSQDLATQWNDGAWLVTYTGHGSLRLWGKDDVFSTDAVSQLSGEHSPPIVLQLTCLTGLFAHPETESLSEVLLTDEEGPVLTIGATSLTLSSHQEPFASRFLEALQDEQIVRIGDALQVAKESLDVNNNGLREISDTFGLLGDPSALIVRP